MAPRGMFSNFFRYFLMASGLPVYCPGQRPVIFALWYAWRVSLVVRYNVDLVRYVYRMTTRWLFPYSLFGLIDVAVTALVADALIGRHARLVRLQKSLAECRYRVTTAERCRTRALRALFGTTLLLSVLSLAYSLSRFSDMGVEKPIADFMSDYGNWFLVLFLSTTCWITTASSALYYCAFCSQLKSMFRSVNDRMARLDESSRRKTTGCFLVGGHFKRKRKKASPLPEEMSKVSSSAPRATPSEGVPFHSPTGVASSSSRLARRIQRLNRQFAAASSLVRETDHLFSLQVLVLLSITFLRTCSYIYIYVSSQWPKVDRWAPLGVAQQIFFDFLAFGSVALEASLVSEEARKYSALVMRADDPVMSNLRVQVQREVSVLTVHASDVQLTAWKFFTVSRSFVPTVVGVTATYVMVILQMLQIVHHKQNCQP